MRKMKQVICHFDGARRAGRWPVPPRSACRISTTVRSIKARQRRVLGVLYDRIQSLQRPSNDVQKQSSRTTVLTVGLCQ